MVDWHVPATVSLVTTFLILCHGVYREVRIRRGHRLKREARETERMERLVADSPALRKLAETIAKLNNPFAKINSTPHRIQATAVPTDIDLPLADEIPDDKGGCPICRAVISVTPVQRAYMARTGYCCISCHDYAKTGKLIDPANPNGWRDLHKEP